MRAELMRKEHFPSVKQNSAKNITYDIINTLPFPTTTTTSRTLQFFSGKVEYGHTRIGYTNSVSSKYDVYLTLLYLLRQFQHSPFPPFGLLKSKTGVSPPNKGPDCLFIPLADECSICSLPKARLLLNL